MAATRRYGRNSAAVIFAWLSIVLAISFLESLLKFRAPSITLPWGWAPAGWMIERSPAHNVYAGLEVVKVAALLIACFSPQIWSVSG